MMEINTEIAATREMLCEICTDPAAALLFALMVQNDPVLRRQGASTYVKGTKFGCHGIMGKMSFTNETISLAR